MEIIFLFCFTDPSNQSRVSLYSLASQGDGDADADGPKLLSSYSLDGDVTEIKKIQCGETAFAVSTSTGGVTLVSTSRYDLNAPLKKINSWEGLHRFR